MSKNDVIYASLILLLAQGGLGQDFLLQYLLRMKNFVCLQKFAFLLRIYTIHKKLT